MEIAASLQAQLVNNPWPHNAANVIFLLDTAQRFERQLLQQWIAQHNDHNVDNAIVTLDLRDDRKTPNVETLTQALEQHPQSIVAPLRISWLQAERAPDAGPRLRDVLRGRERRPPDWLADRVARLNPERLHLTIGEPGSTAELAQRFVNKTGLSPLAQPERLCCLCSAAGGGGARYCRAPTDRRSL